MTRVVRWLRLDEATWSRWVRTATVQSAGLLTVGAYVVFAFDRFGLQGFSEPRGPIRLVLAGFYGWVGLSAATWILATARVNRSTGFRDVFRLFGQAHLPLLLVAIVIQGLSVSLRLQGPALGFAVFALLFWLPALLVVATGELLGVGIARAGRLVAGPYALWLVAIGWFLHNQVGHLL